MTSEWTLALGVVLGGFVVVMFAVSLWAERRIHDVEDFIVAGRRLPFSLALPGLFATWFGAGTLLTATDEIRLEGLRAAALEPLGSGLCLIIAGFFFAKPLWDRKLLTIMDFYRDRFGPRAEWVSGVLMVPGYFGWIAAQFIALGSLIEMLFSLPAGVGVVGVALIGAAYTLIGGMWSVTLTDAVQVSILLIGLIVLGTEVCWELGAGDLLLGLNLLLDGIPPEKRVLIPTEDRAEFIRWCTVLAVAALGNIPAQDLVQRISASKSARIARQACIAAGVLYVFIGFIPVVIGLGAGGFVEEGTPSTLSAVAAVFLHPVAFIVFILAITSAVLSTIDSAILSPASVMAQNLVPQWPALARRLPKGIALNRWMVVVVTAASLGLAISGADAYELLEAAYGVGLVALLVPLALGLASSLGDERAAVVAMVFSTVIWLGHLISNTEDFLALSAYLPATLASATLGLLTYLGVATIKRA